MRNKIKLLFQGDSITDAHRDETHPLGQGYAAKASKMLGEKYRNTPIEFINRGVSGDQTCHLMSRRQEDIIELQPDIVSVLIGINDVWWHSEGKNWMPDEEFERNYLTVLEDIKEHTSAKIMLIEPFLLPSDESKAFFREDLWKKIGITRKLAREYADAFIPLDGILNACCLSHSPEEISADGVHPTDLGAQLIAENYVLYVSPLIDGMINEEK